MEVERGRNRFIDSHPEVKAWRPGAVGEGRASKSVARMFWSGKTVLITGASSGIGAALAQEIGGCGARVGLMARRRPELERLARTLEAAGGRALPLPADVADREAVQGAVEKLEAALGPVDVLVANAGIGGGGTARDMDVAGIEQVFAVNFFGPVHAVAAVLPGMRARRSGHLAAVSSLAGWRGLPGSVAYGPSKAALSLFCESLRVQLRPEGIRVTLVHPGFVKTPLTDQNDYPMPFMVPVERAARLIRRAIEQGKAELCFPWPMVLAARLLRVMPNSLFDRVARRLTSNPGQKRAP